MEIYFKQNAVVPLFSFNYNKWFYLTAVCDGNQLLLYYNGELIGRNIGKTIVSGVERKFNYIGKATYPVGEDVDGIFDEMRIYNRPLNIAEIKYLMNVLV